MIAPIVLFVLTFAVIHAGDGWFTFADFAFLGVLGAMTVGKSLGPVRGRTVGSSCEPAAATVLLLGLAVWAVANILGNYLLTI